MQKGFFFYGSEYASSKITNNYKKYREKTIFLMFDVSILHFIYYFYTFGLKDKKNVCKFELLIINNVYNIITDVVYEPHASVGI